MSNFKTYTFLGKYSVNEMAELTATDFSIADPDDPGMLDIAGFDVAVPNLITEFSKE